MEEIDIIEDNSLLDHEEILQIEKEDIDASSITSKVLVIDNPSMNFRLTKRIFVNIQDLLGKEVKLIFSLDKSLAKSYKAFYDSPNRNSLSKEDFLNNIDELFIYDPKLRTAIQNFIEENYDINIETKNRKETLQFKDSHAKIFLSISMMSKYLIPLITDYTSNQDKGLEEEIIEKFFYSILKSYTTTYDGEPFNVYNKLLSFCKALVTNTLYSDKVIWKWLQNLSINDDILVQQIVRKTIKDIIPKLDIKRSIVSFFYVVIKKQIEYQFTRNVKVSFKPIESIKTDIDSSSTNPFFKIESKLVRRNEMEYIVNTSSLSNYVAINRLKIKNDAVTYYTQNLVITQVQIRLINLYISCNLGNLDVQLADLDTYVKLLILTEGWLKKINSPILAASLFLIPNPNLPSRKAVKARQRLEIYDSIAYKEVLNKYKSVVNRIEQNNLILNIPEIILNTSTDSSFRLVKDDQIFLFLNSAPSNINSVTKKLALEVINILNCM
jgi:hypothetical protein